MLFRHNNVGLPPLPLTFNEGPFPSFLFGNDNLGVEGRPEDLGV